MKPGTGPKRAKGGFQEAEDVSMEDSCGSSAALLSSVAVARAQISVGTGVAPVCPYGYFGYAPYDYAPYR